MHKVNACVHSAVTKNRVHQRSGSCMPAKYVVRYLRPASTFSHRDMQHLHRACNGCSASWVPRSLCVKVTLLHMRLFTQRLPRLRCALSWKEPTQRDPTSISSGNVIPNRLPLLPHIESIFRGGLQPWCFPQRSLALQTLLVRKQDLDLLQSGGRSG